MRSGGPLVLLALLAAAGCTYDPKFDDGKLRCSSAGTCPTGYSCKNSLCFSDSPTAVPPAAVSAYLGTWTLGVTSTVTTTCPGSAPSVTNLSPAANPSLMMIAAAPTGTAADLRSTWLCILDLRVDTAGAHLSDSTPSCSDPGTDPAISLQTWTATQFEIVANTGATAMHTARYNRQDDYANGTTTHCTQLVTAPLTKN